MSIKTLHITNAWHPASGGVATFYRALIKEASRRGQELRIVVPGDEDRIEQLGNSVKIYQIAAPPAFLNSFYRTIYPRHFLFKGSKLQKILALERPDLIEIADKYTLAYLGGLLRMRLLPELDFRPVVVGLSHERMDDNFRSYLGWLPWGRQFCAWYMRRMYFPFFDHHIANSSYTAEELRAASKGHMVTRGTWIRNMGVELADFSPNHRTQAGRAGLLALCGGDENAKILLYAGRLAPEKNLQLLFNVTAQLNKASQERFYLIVAGDGIERTRWKRYAAEHLPGHAVFLGHVRDRQMLATLYANADVFVHPNPHEPFGIAPLEAMASGLPFLGPNLGGITSYAGGHNAWIVPPTVEDFSAAITEMVHSPALVASRTRAALATAQSYRWETVAASFLDLYESLHRSFPGSPIELPAAFHSSLARPGTARVIHWTSQLAQKTFAGIAHLGEFGYKPGTQMHAPPRDIEDQSRDQRSA